MTDEEYVEKYGRMGEKQNAYFAEVKKKTGIPLADIVESFERLGMKMKTCTEQPNPPLPDDKKSQVFMLFLSPEGVGGHLSFSLPRHRVCRVKRPTRKQGAQVPSRACLRG
jgi:hypothetical protein